MSHPTLPTPSAAITLAPAEATGVLSVLAIGDWSHAELDRLPSSMTDGCRLSQTASLEDAVLRLAATDMPPDLIVLAQARPGEHAAAQWSALRNLAPLAGLCVVLGSQSEGETRTGQPLPGVPRIFWHQWPVFWREQQDRTRRGLLPAWSLPATASDEERLLAAAEVTPRAGHRTRVAVLAASSESARALADAAQTGGYRADIWQAETAGADAPAASAEIVLWDAPPAALGDRRQTKRLQRQFPNAKLIGITTFPRFADLAAARTAGVDAVLAKPFRLEHLLAEMAGED